jgi:nucleoside-diphosphate-sugar epimerase
MGDSVAQNSKTAVLVTGGAGFIGSHTAKALWEHGFLPVVFDNLSSGYREAVRWGPFVHGDIRDGRALREAMDAHDVQAVIHFAGLIEVGRSMVRPDLFFDVNVAGMAQVLDAMRDRQVAQLVFSSSAAVYGQAACAALTEDLPKAPSSCYGETKLIGEWMIADYCRAFGFSGVALRYFNAAGADPSGTIGEAHFPETHLIGAEGQARQRAFRGGQHRRRPGPFGLRGHQYGGRAHRADATLQRRAAPPWRSAEPCGRPVPRSRPAGMARQAFWSARDRRRRGCMAQAPSFRA